MLKAAVCAYCAVLSFSSVAFAMTDLPVPSDTKAKYSVIQNKRSGDMAVIQTFRKGPSGTSFATRLFNCRKGTYKYLVEVDGEENINEFMQKNNEAMDQLNETGMSAVSEGSITYYVFKYACR